VTLEVDRSDLGRRDCQSVRGASIPVIVPGAGSRRIGGGGCGCRDDDEPSTLRFDGLLGCARFDRMQGVQMRTGPMKPRRNSRGESHAG